MGQSRTIRKITEVQNIPAANVSGISSDRAYVIIQVDSKGQGDNTRKLYNNNNQLRIKVSDLLGLTPAVTAQSLLSGLPVSDGVAQSTGDLYIDDTTGAVTVKQ